MFSPLIYIPGRSAAASLPTVGSPEFNAIIQQSTAKAKKRQPAADESVSPELQRERDTADAFLSEHNRILKAIEQRTSRK